MKRLTLSRRKKFAFALVVLVGLYATAELAAWLLIVVQHGDLTDISRLRESAAQNRPSGVVTHVAEHVVHPYLGYVSVPNLPKTSGGRHVTDYGFYDTQSPIHKRSPDKLVVAITGGSFAEALTVDGSEVLARELEALPQFAGRKAVIVQLALQGYKQPQQLNAVTYHLAIGAEFDVVVNVDGFNEVVLAPSENVSNDIAAAYPRSWHHRVAETSTYEALAKVARISVMQETARERAVLMQTSPLKYSMLANLIWKVSNDRLARQMADAESEFSKINAKRREYWVNGPPETFASEADLDQYLVGIWSRSSKSLDAVCKANGIRYIHCLQPNQYVPDSKPIGPDEARVAINTLDSAKPTVERCFPQLREAGERLAADGEEFHDLTGVYREHGEPLYKDGCCHVNALGSQIVAAEIARIIGEK